MRLIDADALKDILQNLSYDDWGVSTTWANAFEECADMVENMPTIEPERKTGKWINAECKDGTTAHKCSECRRLVGYSVRALTWFNFCPWCGAEMGESHE